MAEKREVPSGTVYWQVLDAQVQLSRHLQAGRKDPGTTCLSAEGSSRRQKRNDDNDGDINVVRRLPDTVVATSMSSDIIKHLTEKKENKHKAAVEQLEAELTGLAQVCQTQVTTAGLHLLASLQDVDLRLDTLEDRMNQVEHLSLQQVSGLWDEVEEGLQLKKIKITDFNQTLIECETQRTDEIRAILKKHCNLLEKISFLPVAEIHRLIHSKATMLNMRLLMNRRSIARVVLRLQEENLKQTSLLRLHWESCLGHWTSSRASQVVRRFKSFLSGDDDMTALEQQVLQQVRPSQYHLTVQRCEIICQVISLVPPSCSLAVVSDWFSQLSVVNQQVDSLHSDIIRQLRSHYEKLWQNRLAQVQHCEKELAALQLSEDEVADMVNSQLLPLTQQRQREEEQRLYDLDLWSDSLSRAAVRLSRSVFVVMRAAVLLWEIHSRNLERQEEELLQKLNDIRCSQEQRLQRKKVCLYKLLDELRQASNEDILKMTLEKTVHYLLDIKVSTPQCVTDQCVVLDCLPQQFVDELFSYSSRLSTFYHLTNTYTPSPEELQNLLQPSGNTRNITMNQIKAKTRLKSLGKIPNMSKKRPISSQNDVAQSHDWLIEADSYLLNLYDISSHITLTSSRGVSYSGPTFRSTSPNLQENAQQEMHMSLFPTDLLADILSQTRTLFLNHLEKHFHDLLSSVVARVTEGKEAVHSVQEFYMQLLDPQQIQTHIYQPRLAELQLHQQRVDAHSQEVSDGLMFCRAEFQELQTLIGRKNQELTITLSNMEGRLLKADTSQRVEALSVTLQDCLNHHVKHTQHCQTRVTQTLRVCLRELRHKTVQLHNSFRLFSEGGDFATLEVKLFQKRLKEEIKRICMTEESVYNQLEHLQVKSLEKLKKESGRLEEKIGILRSEMIFTERIQKILSSTQVQLKAEAAANQGQLATISCYLVELRRMIDNPQVCPDQVCVFLSSVREEVRKRFQYLDMSLTVPGQQESVSLPSCPKSGKKTGSTPLPGLQQRSRSGVNILDDPVIGMVRSLSNFCVIVDAAETEPEKQTEPREARKLKAATGQGIQCPQQRRLQSSHKSIKTDRKFQIFGSRPEADENPESFESKVNSILQKCHEALLLVGKDFYQSTPCGTFERLPQCLDQWAESMQQRLLGYQEEARMLLGASRGKLAEQQCELDKLCPLPAALICNNEHQQ
ncbi:coiled-coil domain-containing protein 180 [Aulostomus maculatus]